MLATILLACLLPQAPPAADGAAPADPTPLLEEPADAYPGWRLAVQAWTFNRFSFHEALEKTAELGLGWLEAFPGQRLGAKPEDGQFHHQMPEAARAAVRARLKAAGVRLVGYGVVALPADEAECRRVFAFAREMGIETIVSEPPPEALDLVARLAEEFKIGVALHNHPQPSRYWNPQTVLDALKGRSPLLGACADTGHWLRSGVAPLEALRLLKGRIRCLHFKDLDKAGTMAAHDVVWGSGAGDVPGLLAELQRQGFRGHFAVEYEHNWEHSLPEVRRSAAFFDKTAAALRPGGWRPLLGESLAGCLFPEGAWTLSEGVLARTGKGDLWTKARFGDFLLQLDFKLAPGTNSGVFLRTGEIAQWLHTAIEVQILDSHGKQAPSKHDCGAIYDCLEPARNAVRPAGEWNRLRVVAAGPRILVALNGERIIDMDLERWTEAGKNPDGSKNKFRTAYKEMPREGHLGFQDHGNPVWFRNLRIRELPR